MRLSFTKINLIIPALLIMAFVGSCSHDEDVRMPQDILGVWSPSADVYLEFMEDNVVHNLRIEQQEEENIGIWTTDVYYYEPGYNLVIYLDSSHEAKVYQIIDMTSEEFTWCWVYDMEVADADSVGKILGDIINKAQEGFQLDPDLYQNFRHIPKNTFYQIIQNLEFNYPW